MPVSLDAEADDLARDLLALKERYRVGEVQPVDLFPHTFHIESVAKLIKRS